MNSKKFTEAMSKIDNKYVGEALFYNGTRLAKKSSKRIAALVAAIIAVLGQHRAINKVLSSKA